MTMIDTWCPCCTFGNHTEPCTCNGTDCCHGWRHKHGGLRNQIALALSSCQGATTWARMADAVMTVVEPIVEGIEQRRMEAVVDAQEDTAKAEAQVARIRAFLEDMAGWCSPHGVAAGYSRRGLDALDGVDPLGLAGPTREEQQ